MLPRRLLIASVATLVASIVISTVTSAGDALEFQNGVETNPLAAHSEFLNKVKLNRERRQTRRPNIFGLFFQLIGETQRDIQKTFNDIAREVESGLVDENTIDNTTAAAAPEGDGASTERPRVSRQEFMRILSRNWRGLTRLFNREVEIALNQSNRNAAEARRAFWDSLAPFLEPATTTARSTTTSRSGKN